MVKNRVLSKSLALLIVFAMLVSLLSVITISVYGENDDMVGIEMSGELSSTGIRVDFDTAGGEAGQSPLYRYASIPFEQGGIPVPGSYIIGATYMPSPPTKTHFVFRHWSLMPTCINDPSDIFTEDSEVFEPITVYAQWGHRIVFDGNGITLGNLDVDPIYDYSYASRIVPRNGTVNATMGMVWPIDPERQVINIDPDRRPWVFDGWYDTREQTGGNRFDGDTPIENNVMLFARWIRRDPDLVGTIIQVTFDFQGGVFAHNSAHNSNMREFVSGSTLDQSNSLRPDINAHITDFWTRRNAPNIRNGNFSFGGWWTAPGGPYGGGVAITTRANTSLSSNFRPTEPMTLYAYWEIRISISPLHTQLWRYPPGLEWPGWEQPIYFSSQSRYRSWDFYFPSTHPLPITWDDLPLGFPTDPSASTMKFLGWSNDCCFLNPVTVDTVFYGSSQIFAFWEIEKDVLVINFDANGGAWW